LLGIPVARLGERAPGNLAEWSLVGEAAPLDDPPLVVDLSSLWAGPLCSRLLREHDARVVKVESKTRADGARNGPVAFFDLMHAGKEFTSIDFTAEALRPLLLEADVVIEGSRPRALEQLGIDAREIIVDGPRVWLSITGHGREEPQRNWVGFGDDAAVAGGLVGSREGTPCFMGDAIADPLTGIAGAAAVLAALKDGGRWMIDCNLAGVAAYVAGDGQ
jgi:crotonobetainyl-CoA:carnitine CoA-transferase CaiB-like acyl-CoA transferase